MQRTLLFSAVLALCLHLPNGAVAGFPPLPAGAILDLDADHGVELKDGKVIGWRNQIEWKARDFKPTRADGSPGFISSSDAIRGHAALVFRKQELVNDDEDAFDHLTTGSGYTWVTVLAPEKQIPMLQDVNSFFGNLRNGGNFEGFWAGLNDDNSVWAGSRNSTTFGRWDKNNPKVLGPKLTEGRFYVIAGRMGSGTGEVSIELFVNSATTVASQAFPVNPKANASKMAIGQERDAREHPGKESFEGEMARMLMWDRPLTDAEMKEFMEAMMDEYRIRGPGNLRNRNDI